MDRIKIGTAVTFKNGRGYSTGKVVAINGDLKARTFARPDDLCTVRYGRAYPSKKLAAGTLAAINKRGRDLTRAAK